jgi:hypothetical protein
MSQSDTGLGRPDPVGKAFRRALDASRAHRGAMLGSFRKPPSDNPMGNSLPSSVEPLLASGRARCADPTARAIASTAAPPQMCGVPYHRFKVGQTVAAPSGGPLALIPRGVHVIVRLLPLDGGEPQYRILSKVDGHERCVLESWIVPVEEDPKADEPAPRSPTEKSSAYRGRRY